MSRQGDRMRLGVFFQPAGHHIACWRHSSAQADAESNFQHYAQIARTAERGKFDMLFLADSLAVREFDHLDPLSRTIGYAVHFEPLTLLAALSVVTARIGLVATATTTYNEPYHVARKFASLDNLSGGRAGWNLVTSSSADEAYNFSRDRHVAHADRYARAREFAQVVTGLWDSWEDGSFLHDKASGRHFDPATLHALNHVGAYFSVRGPLNVPRSPQGHPVIVQAGASGPGRALAAETAEVIFTVTQTITEAQAFYADIKGRLDAFGRSPEHVKIMPGVFPVVGRTMAEAQEKLEELQSLIQPEVGLWLLSTMLGGVDLSGYPLDDKLPELPESNGEKGRRQVLIDLARRENLTIRQLYMWIAGARGHCTVIGTSSQVADQLEAWFVGNAADGFNILPPTLPGGLDDFVDMVVPELQRRGLFRKEYEGRTLRENLGLPRPPHPSRQLAAVTA